jgi:3-hydroxybutyryl-CoA dehydrogenase
MSNGAPIVIGVIGAGTMGQGIAQVCAASGCNVILFDVEASLIESAVNNIGKNLEVLIQKGKASEGDKHQILQRITPVFTLTEVKAQIIIEAVIEKLSVKQDIFKVVEENNAQDSILTSNTSSIPVTHIGKNLKWKNRFAGLHFFNPPTIMKLVEIVQGTFTDDKTIDALRSFCKLLNKEAVLVQDSPGFIVNRVARHYYVEALKILEEGVADVETIDLLMRNAGFKMGPFELMDLIGVDTNLLVTKSIYEGFNQEPRFRPSRIQQQKVDAGHHGRKSGRGFYDYTK